MLIWRPRLSETLARHELSLRMQRFVAICCLAACVARPAAAQERGTNGQIFGEILPFVGLDGVRVEVTGILGVIYNLREVNEEPAKAATGLSRTELEQLDRAIHSDVADAFRRRGMPWLRPGQESPDVRPRLVVDVAWSRLKSDTIVINVTTTLLEAARLTKDPSRIVWAPSWGERLFGKVASPDSLARDLRSAALGGVHNFVELYARAHAR
jgi:hypothetical protein